jgi:hypothetical protein
MEGDAMPESDTHLAADTHRATDTHRAADTCLAAFRPEADEEGLVYTVRDEDGYPAPAGADGVRAMPFWSEAERAQQIVAQVPPYQGFRVVAIDLADWLSAWLPCLDRDGLNAGINWSGPRATGQDLTPDQVLTWFAADVEPVPAGIG